MPHPFPLASVFSNGMRRDVDRTEIPGGSAYNMVDFIPDEVQAVTGGRGGWSYYGSTLSGATSLPSLSYHPDTDKVVATDQNRNLWDVVAGTQFAGFSALLPSVPGGRTYHRGYLIFPDATGAVAPAYYKSDGTVGTLAAAPHGMGSTTFKDHAVLFRGQTQTNRIWFSAPGDPTTWDTTFGWWDTTGQIVYAIGLGNSILVFHPDSTERLRGTTPPPGSDFVLEPFLPNVGCIEGGTIAYWKNQVVFCSAQGIYMTDGAGSVDLTASAGMKTYWASIMSNYTSSWKLQGGIYRDHYIISVNNGTTLVDCLCVSLTNQTMWRFSNIHSGNYVNVQQGQKEELYMALTNAGRVGKLSTLWAPSASVKNDADGTNPTPIVETGMFRGFDRLHRRWIESMGKQKWRFAYIDYDLRDAASDNPTMTLSYCKTPTGAYTATDRTLPETTDISRVRRSLSPTQGGATHSQMLGLKLAVNGPYSSAKLYTLEGVFEPIEIGAL